MNRTELMKTREMRELAAHIRYQCRGTQYKYSAASPMKHVGCIMESSEFSGIYTCHTCQVQGIN